MHVSEAFRYGTQRLSQICDAPELDVKHLLLKVLEQDAQTLSPWLHQTLTREEILRFENLLLEAESGKPLAYILGYSDFGQHRYRVGSGVLIPRPDTEILIEAASSWLQEHGTTQHLILECGLGTGIISLELATRFPAFHFYGWELDPTAFQFAFENRRLISPNNTTFFLGNFFNLTPFLKNHHNTPILILSNPPYISQSELRTLDSSVIDFEPRLALDGGVDGLTFYRQLFSAHYPSDSVVMFLEIGFAQFEQVRELGESLGWTFLKCFKDFSERDRTLLFSR